MLKVIAITSVVAFVVGFLYGKGYMKQSIELDSLSTAVEIKEKQDEVLINRPDVSGLVKRLRLDPNAP